MAQALQLQQHYAQADLLSELRSLEGLYRHYYDAVFNYLLQMSGSRELAEELTQETFIKAGAALINFRGDCTPSTWLFRIARNAYIDHVRRPSASRIKTDQLLALPDEGHYGDPVRQYAASEQRSLIGIALGQLPEKLRTVLLLRDAEGLAYAEIADVLNISLSAVKINLFRARNAFRAAYETLIREDHS